MTLVVAAIIQNSQGEFLCCKRGDWKSSPNKWEFPGGKPESGESLDFALIREIREELGVEIKVLRQFDRSTTGDIELVCFVCDLVGKEPTSSTDHSELRWVREQDLARLDWAEPDLPALKRILIPFC
ncbi:(deoxy)nucleoside triphosphate pyrophosphohydrolase [Aquiluna sp. KACHI24]|uniref:(deoxy)nucleoside triphosphate pyrophosphohydrolase n=1 Tax=Aquiluna sp. KACHI24 TaxID=2968831 RepID=UPI00220C795B|nr:(deoxy)nucleoside triphosphate pyrophosphohydrolase [Aquiluna sp. KACHI24]BDQ00996.1 DNA mismatch repair protein MutT [Aquiluna sp. KACHI24]